MVLRLGRLREVAVVVLGPLVFSLIFLFGFEDLVLYIAFSSLAMAILSILVLGWENVARSLRLGLKEIFIGVGYSLPLYVAFYAGYVLTGFLGLSGEVEAVYGVVSRDLGTLALLGIASIGEEVYWRGVVQETVLRKWGFPWWYSSLVYSAAHVASLMPVLVLAAFVAGLGFGFVASRHGVCSSIAMHFSWLVIMFYIAPVV